MTDDYVATARKAGRCADCSYKLDRRFARCIGDLFRGSTVTELGAGIGRYKKSIEPLGVRQYTAYDGMLNVEIKSRGVVRYADLSTHSVNTLQHQSGA